MSVAIESQPEAASPSRERVELILGHLDRLPTLPPVAARVLALAASEKSSARDLVEVIELDPALTAGILRLVRRCDLGVSQKGMTVGRAVTLLGFHAVRNAVLCSEFFDCFSNREPGAAAEVRKQLWVHGVAVACAAEHLAAAAGRLDLRGDAFVCGLLHDIGKIALQSCLPKSYQRIVERVQTRRAAICDAEQEVLGIDHAIAGKRLASRWGLPPSVIEAVWLHHQDVESLPGFVTCPDMVRIVHLADAAVRSLNIGFSGSPITVDPARGSGQLGLGPEWVQDLAAELPRRMTGLLDTLGLDADFEFDYARSLETAHRELRRICGELTEENRTLTARGKLFDVIGRFTEKLLTTRSVADVCALAADSICSVMQALGVCVYAIDRQLGICYAGWCESGAGVRTDAFDAADLAEARAINGFNGGGGTIRPAGPAQFAIWSRCFADRPPESLWVLPLGTARIEAGVLISTQTHGSPEHFQDWGVVARTIGSAMALALSRNEAERAAEESLDLNRRLKDAQSKLLRMRSIGMIAEMAAGAAHELNNPLAVISGRAQMELAAGLDPERRKALELIVAQTHKAAQIVLDLMCFAKPDPPTPIQQPLSIVLNTIYQHWQGQLGRQGPKLSIAVADYEATVFADTSQLIQAINEVVANAAQAAESASRWVRINSHSRASDETVRIVVEDNGPGMAAEVLEHAIDPFFSSRPAGRGRGLGLSKAYRLVEINGGHLWLESKLNAGTTVTIELPARAPNSAV